MKSAHKKNGKTLAPNRKSASTKSLKSKSQKTKTSKREMIPNVLHHVRDDYLKLLGIERDAIDNAKVIIITGDNATGKSFLRRIFSFFAKKEHSIDSIHLSQQARTTGGVERAFVYGGEDEDSTGYITAGTFIMGFKTSRGRDNDHLLIWDEPEIGLGEEAQAGAAQFMVDQLKDWPPKLRGLVVMTHSRIFVTALKDLEGARFINLGKKYKTADEWLSRKIEPVTPESIRERGIDTWRKFQKLMDKAKKEK